MPDLETRVRRLERSNRLLMLALGLTIGAGVFAGASGDKAVLDSVKAKRITLVGDEGKVLAFFRPAAEGGAALGIASADGTEADVLISRNGVMAKRFTVRDKEASDAPDARQVIIDRAGVIAPKFVEGDAAGNPAAERSAP
ncbi:MAG TPA: hypothetical protein VMF30_00830 [Pirellulales bacterium]|nr:hypothetical protein [Pirellulales bacterium]